MIKRIIYIFTAMFLGILALVSAVGSVSRFHNVGVTVCRKCHSVSGGQTQYEIWLTSPHARAYETLKGEKAMEIARGVGITEAWKDRVCLKCHTTGGGRSEITGQEGVGCEACHGPGSSYHDGANHINYEDRRKGYATAKKHGMYPILDYEDNLLKREKLCLNCHDERRPCMPVTMKEIKAQKITIQVIDTLRKGDVNFSHPLRRY